MGASDPNPNETGDDEFKPQKNILRSVASALSSDNPLLNLIKAIFSFIADLFRPDSGTGDMEAGNITPQERQAINQRNEEERKAAVASHTTFEESARRELTSGKIIVLPQQLQAMRVEAEKANGGRHVEAIMPVASDGRITESFGKREKRAEHSSTDHKGLDIASKTPGGKPDIISAMPGVVLAVGWRNGYGKTIDVLDIYGERHRYAHLDSITVKEGQAVRQGEKIGVMGATGGKDHVTGVHLHYEQRSPGAGFNDPGVAHDPKLMGRNWADGQRFALADTQALIASQSPVAGQEPPTQVASLQQAGDLMKGVSQGQGYVAPVPQSADRFASAFQRGT